MMAFYPKVKAKSLKLSSSRISVNLWDLFFIPQISQIYTDLYLNIESPNFSCNSVGNSHYAIICAKIPQ